MGSGSWHHSELVSSHLSADTVTLSPNIISSLPPHCHPNGCCSDPISENLFVTRQKCRGGQQTLISCTLFQILHLQLAVLFQTKSPMSTFSVSGPKILSHIMPRSADDDTVIEISTKHVQNLIQHTPGAGWWGNLCCWILLS